MKNQLKDQQDICAISHKHMTMESGSPDTATFTRFNPKKPFVKGNAVWCRDCIASAMAGISYETYLEFAGAIVRNQLPPDDDYFSTRSPEEFPSNTPESLKNDGDNQTASTEDM